MDVIKGQTYTTGKRYVVVENVIDGRVYFHPLGVATVSDMDETAFRVEYDYTRDRFGTPENPLQRDYQALVDSQQTAKGVANVLSAAVNRGMVPHYIEYNRDSGQYKHAPGELARELVNDHPTLQQEKMRLFMQFCTALAELSYVDARNQDSQKLARAIIERCQEELHLSFV